MSNIPQATASASADTHIKLSENARTVLAKRYLRKGPDGKPVETAEQMFRRVARAIAQPEAEYGGDVAATAEQFCELLSGLRFFPNSPTFTGAGTPLGQLAACFVLPISDDMGRRGDGIFQTLRDAALIQQTGGGNGFSFSRLRPKGAYVAQLPQGQRLAHHGRTTQRRPDQVSRRRGISNCHQLGDHQPALFVGR